MTNAAIHFKQHMGTPVPRSEGYPSQFPSLTLFLSVIFFTPFLPSEFRGLLFISTSQPVNLRSLDGHLSSPEHQAVWHLLTSIPLLQILNSLLFCQLSFALPAGLKALRSLLLFSTLSPFPQSADGWKNASEPRGKALRQEKVSQGDTERMEERLRILFKYTQFKVCGTSGLSGTLVVAKHSDQGFVFSP